jgi:hypothetical protein
LKNVAKRFSPYFALGSLKANKENLISYKTKLQGGLTE